MCLTTGFSQFSRCRLHSYFCICKSIWNLGDFLGLVNLQDLAKSFSCSFSSVNRIDTSGFVSIFLSLLIAIVGRKHVSACASVFVSLYSYVEEKYAKFLDGSETWKGKSFLLC